MTAPTATTAKRTTVTVTFHARLVMVKPRLGPLRDHDAWKFAGAPRLNGR